MKRFAKFLTEKMSHQQALDILNLKPGFTDEQLKAARRDAAMRYHPDKGGDTNKMQDANAAYDVLKNTAGKVSSTGGSQYDRQWWEDQRKKDDALMDVVIETIQGYLDVDAFTKHFAHVFGEPFTNTINTPRKSQSGGVSWVGEWANATRSIVCTLNDYVSIDELRHNKVLSNPETWLKQIVTTSILANRKDVKLTNSRYSFDRRSNVLSTPELSFPAAKLKKAVARNETRKFSKRDALLTFAKELKGELSDDGVWVPIGPFKMYLYRMTMMGAAMWGHNGLYLKHRRVSMLPTAFIYENAEHMEFLFNNLKKIQQHFGETASEADVVQAVTSMLNSYKAFKDAHPNNEPLRRR